MALNYQYALVDLSILLTRNAYACSRGKEVGEYSASDIVKMTFQTINKLGRDYGIVADKIIFLADRWSPEYGGYYKTWMLGGNYKDSRSWMTPEKLKEISEDPSSTSQDIEKAEKELYLEGEKSKAKTILKTEFTKIGLPCFDVPGLEYDDLCYIISSLLYSSGATKKSVIVTKDSDCMYCTSPACDYFRLPIGGSSPEIMTYDDIYNTLPDEIRKRGISLYDYKAMHDSLDGGHNDMRRTRLPRKNSDKIIVEILDGDFSKVENPDLYSLQRDSFRLENYPMISQAIQEITTKLPRIGHIGRLEEFQELCKSVGIEGIPDRYYREFTNKLDQRLYSE